jgi:hypothetical protein
VPPMIMAVRVVSVMRSPYPGETIRACDNLR